MKNGFAKRVNICVGLLVLLAIVLSVAEYNKPKVFKEYPENGEGTVLAFGDGLIEIALNGDPDNTMTLNADSSNHWYRVEDGVGVGSYVYFSYMNSVGKDGRYTVDTVSLAPIAGEPATVIDKRIPWSNAR